LQHGDEQQVPAQARENVDASEEVLEEKLTGPFETCSLDLFPSGQDPL
jgi:hypothetical protein